MFENAILISRTRRTSQMVQLRRTNHHVKHSSTTPQQLYTRLYIS